MRILTWETGAFFGVPASFFFIPLLSRIHPEFAAIYTDLSGIFFLISYG